MIGSPLSATEVLRQVTAPLRWTAAAGAALLALGCASPPPPAPVARGTYVILLDNADGSAGQIQVTGANGTTVIDKAYQGTSIGGAQGNQFTATADEVVRDFAAAIDASPTPPQRYELYFVFGNSTLTEASRKELPRIIEALGQRPAADMSITGHTDTAGDERRNERLGLDRARQVAELLNAQRRIPADRISIESHGEKNPLIKTPDGVPEPRNRRVEVTIR